MLRKKKVEHFLSMFQSVMGIYKFTDRVNRFSKKRNCSMILDNKRTLENIDTFTIVSLCLHSYYAKLYPQIQVHNKKRQLSLIKSCLFFVITFS